LTALPLLHMTHRKQFLRVCVKRGLRDIVLFFQMFDKGGYFTAVPLDNAVEFATLSD
jgi:hypothetical protein